jgi:hypothetical protein
MKIHKMSRGEGTNVFQDLQLRRAVKGEYKKRDAKETRRQILDERNRLRRARERYFIGPL